MTLPSSKNFIVSYSGGKDAAIAFYRAVKEGREAVGAITTFDRKRGHSWFHRLPEPLLKKIEKSLGIPFKIIDAEGDRYAEDFESALKTFKNSGVDAVVFGDVDIPEHYDWCDRRCRNAGLKSLFPLWQNDRRKIVGEMIDAGFQALITIVDTSRMNEKFLGKTLTKKIVAEIAAEGADPCGENGEYHTFVYDGPIFRHRIEFSTDVPAKLDNHAYLPVR